MGLVKKANTQKDGNFYWRNEGCRYQDPSILNKDGDYARHLCRWPALIKSGLLLTSQRTLGNQSEQFSFCNLLSFISFLTLLTSELHKQWNMKMKRPCNELQRAKRYWKTIVWLPRAKTPNIHVIPSKGNKTVIDFRPDLMKTRKEQKFDELNSCFLFIVYKFS